MQPFGLYAAGAFGAFTCQQLPDPRHSDAPTPPKLLALQRTLTACAGDHPCGLNVDIAFTKKTGPTGLDVHPLFTRYRRDCPGTSHSCQTEEHECGGKRPRHRPAEERSEGRRGG